MTQFARVAACCRVAERKGQPPEPAADGVRFVSWPIGWLRLAAPFGSQFIDLGFVGPPSTVGCPRTYRAR